MLKYLFGAIFVGLAWALVLVFHDVVPLWPAVAVSAVVIGGLTALAVFRVMAARKAAAGIENGLRDQAGRQNAGMRPDLQVDIAAMAAEFQKAVRNLKSSKLGRGGRDALGLLPWYVVVGPPGSGKTTAIRNSGIKFPSGRSAAVRGVGGTRNCDWWMTNDAILLDTAGRWSTEDDDREEWFAFLDLLKTTRPKKPINGMIVAIPATELQGTQEQIAELARALRERLDEVVERLDMVLPIYIFVTKCDLVAGFVETFADLKDRDRGQIWGFTLPLVSEHSDHLDAVAQHFNEMQEVLERHAILRMGEERRIEARAQILTFPQQFDSLRQGLIDLVSVLFDESVYHDAPIMRGVYFTSGTQEGRPVDRVMASMAEAFGVRPTIASPPPAKPKSYFVRDLFQQVVFPDGDVAVRSTRVLQRQRLSRWAMAGAALVASGLFLVLPISSYMENDQLITEARTFVEKLVRARTEHGPTGPLAPRALESADATAMRMATFAAKGPDIALRFGLYPGERLLGPVRTGIEKLLVRPLLDADAAQLSSFAQARSETDASGAQSGLMLHLLLTQRKEADEPAPESDGWRERWVEVAAAQAGARWAALAGGAATSKARRALENAVRFYASRTTTAADLVERKVSVVSRVRTTLLGTAEGDPLAEFVQDPSMPRDVRVIDIIGGAVTSFQTPDRDKAPGAQVPGTSVPGAFTPAGWQLVKARIERLTADHEHDENGWVLGAARKRNHVDAAALQANYFRRYIETWKEFLLALSVKEPTNIGEVRALLKSLMMEKPLESIWRNAGKDLVFKDDSVVGAALAKGKAGLGERLTEAKKKLLGDPDQDTPNAPPGGPKPSGDEPTSPEDVNREFASFLGFGLTKPSGLETYGQIVVELAAAIGDAGDPDPKAFGATVKAQNIKLANLIASYNDKGWEARFLAHILMPPLRGAETAVSGATGESANRKWCDSIAVVYDQLLAGRYPFAGGAGVRETRAADLDKFFAPKAGTLWQYFAESLAADIDHPPGTTVFHLKEQPSVKYKPNLLAFLKRAQEVTDLLYSKDPAKMGIALSMRIRPSPPYAKIVFESGGKKITYINATERWEDLVWPARGALFRLIEKSSIDQRSVEGQIGYPEGEWALFQLLERAKLSPVSDTEEYLSGTWGTGMGGIVHADVKPLGLLRTFRALDFPRSIVAGAAGCRK